MKNFFWGFLFIVFVSSAFAQTRTWTDKSGRFSVEAELVSQKGDQVKLRREDGKVIGLPVSKLSQTDRTL